MSLPRTSDSAFWYSKRVRRRSGTGLSASPGQERSIAFPPPARCSLLESLEQPEASARAASRPEIPPKNRGRGRVRRAIGVLRVGQFYIADIPNAHLRNRVKPEHYVFSIKLPIVGHG